MYLLTGMSENNEYLRTLGNERTNESTGPLAKEYTLDIPRIPSLELPLHVSARADSVQKAINMCGGIHKVKEAFREGGSIESQKGLELYLNHDPAHAKKGERFFNEHPIIGKRVPYRDDSVILKISLPKGTLKKHQGSVQKALSNLDSKDYKVTPVAIVNNTIKFREMSDFQIRLDNVPSAKEFESSFGSLEWNNFKNFVRTVPDNDSKPYENINKLIIDRNSKSPSTDFQLPPPPRFSMVRFPQLYKYKGNPLATKKSNGVTEVKGTYIKNYQLFVHDISESTTIPVSPHPKLQSDYDNATENNVYPGTKSDSKFYESLVECLGILKELFSKRPIWVKRHIDGIVPKRLHHTLKIALALISYRFTMGPWRNTYIKFGIDPRSSPEFAKYQTEYFKIERKLLSSPVVKKNVPKIPSLVFESNRPGDIDSRFIFDGNQVPWYLMLQIDLLVTEPNIAEVYNKAEYLKKPNKITGWFTELDLVKIRRIVKYELGCLAVGNHNFNIYKLKYFKSIQFAKESLITDSVKDSDGDIDMDRNLSATNVVKDEDDDDNGIATGEVDDNALEAEEGDADDNIPIDEDDEDINNEQDEFDLKSATFQDIIERISKLDPNSASQLERDLEGFVYETKL